MTTPTLKLYPPTPSEKNDLQQRLEKDLNDVFSLLNSINNIKEMITYSKDKDRKSEKKYKR